MMFTTSLDKNDALMKTGVIVSSNLCNQEYVLNISLFNHKFRKLALLCVDVIDKWLVVITGNLT